MLLENNNAKAGDNHLFSIAFKPPKVLHQQDGNSRILKQNISFVASSLTHQQLSDVLFAKNSYRCVAWSKKNLLAFSSLSFSHLGNHKRFPIYVMEASQPTCYVCLESPHTTPVKTILWNHSSHSFLSSDESGLTCLWEMTGNVMNNWQCVYKDDSSDNEMCALKWANSTRVLEESGTAIDFKIPYRRKYRCLPNVNLAIAPGSVSWLAVTNSCEIKVVHRQPGQRKFSVTQSTLAYATAVTQASISFYPDNEVLICVNVAKTNRVILFSLKLDFSGKKCAITSNQLYSVVLTKNTNSISHVCLSPNLHTWFSCTSAMNGGHNEIKRWVKSSEYYETNPGGVFNNSTNQSNRPRTCWKGDALEISESTERICHLTLSPSGKYLAIVFFTGLIIVKDLSSSKEIRCTKPVLKNPTEKWCPKFKNQASIISLSFSPNECCICAVDNIGAVHLFQIWPFPKTEVNTPSFSSPIHQFALKFELSLLQDHDYWDVITCLQTEAPNLSLNPFNEIMENLESSLSVQSIQEKSRFGPLYASLGASIFRHLSGKNIVDCIDYNCKLSLSVVVSVLRLVSSPVNRDISKNSLANALAEDEATLEKVVSFVRMEKSQLQSLIPVVNWTIYAIVFFLKNVVYLSGLKTGFDNLTKPKLTELIYKYGIPSVRFLFELPVIELMRELCVYVLYIQDTCDPDQSKKDSLMDVNLLYIVLSDILNILGKRQDIFAGSTEPSIPMTNLKNLLIENSVLLENLKHRIFEQGRLLKNLSYLPLTPSPVSRGSLVILNLRRKDVEFVRTYNNYENEDENDNDNDNLNNKKKHKLDIDCLRHVYLPPNIPSKKCVRCGRVSAKSDTSQNGNWTWSWNNSCICGGLWASN